jgi:hypothetical protein
MSNATSLLDKKTAIRLLQHGIFLSNKTPPITNHQALVLLAEGVVDNFVKEFKGIVKELLAGCSLDDLRATQEEMRAWFGEEAESGHQAEQAKRECPSEEGSLSYSSECKEVDEKMKFDMQSKLDEYMRLLDQIKQRTGDSATAVSVLQELSKDRRAAERQADREPQDSQPATPKQKEFMTKLGIDYPADVTKQYASQLIDVKRGKNNE